MDPGLTFNDFKRLQLFVESAGIKLIPILWNEISLETATEDQLTKVN